MCISYGGSVSHLAYSRKLGLCSVQAEIDLRFVLHILSVRFSLSLLKTSPLFATGINLTIVKVGKLQHLICAIWQVYQVQRVFLSQLKRENVNEEWNESPLLSINLLLQSRNLYLETLPSETS